MKAPKKQNPKMALGMDFDEALERYIGTKPDQVAGNIERSKKKKPPRAKKKRTRGGSPASQNVVALRDARRKRQYG